MKVILTRDVAKLGKRFSVAEVPDGYALNKLIPAGIAMAATPENLKKIGARTDKQASTQLSHVEAFKQSVRALKTVPVSIAMEANAQDHLFKAVKPADIAAAAAAAGHPLPVESISITEPIKALGTYEIPVAVGDVRDVILVTIIRA